MADLAKETAHSPRLTMSRHQSGRQDLNLRPPGPKPGALIQAELRPVVTKRRYLLHLSYCQARLVLPRKHKLPGGKTRQYPQLFPAMDGMTLPYRWNSRAKQFVAKTGYCHNADGQRIRSYQLLAKVPGAR